MKALKSAAALLVALSLSATVCVAKEDSPPLPVPAPGVSPNTSPDQSQNASPGEQLVEPTPELRKTLCRRVWQQVAEEYVDEGKLSQWDKSGTKCDADFASDEELDKAIYEMVESVGDRWTKYKSRPVIRAHQKMRSEGLVQAGALLRRHSDSRWHIDSLSWGSPAHASVLKEGDIILSVNGKPLSDRMSDIDVWDLLVGKPGEKIKVAAVMDGVVKEVELTLYSSSDDEVAIRILPDNVLYIRLPTFEKPAVVQNFLVKLRQVYFQKKGAITGVVFDLRNNPGGLFDLALRVSSTFIESGTIVRTTVHKGATETVTEHKTRAMPPFAKRLITEDHALDYIEWAQNTPMVVLINGSSASCSEITAGALQDNKRAFVIGSQSFGKSVGFTMNQLPNGGVLTVTSMKYLTPSGKDIDDKGITPDLVVVQPRVETTDLALKAAHAHIVEVAAQRSQQVQDGRDIANKSKDELGQSLDKSKLLPLLFVFGAVFGLIAFAVFLWWMKERH